MGEISQTFSKWWQFQVFKESYVLKGLLFMKYNHTKRILVKIHIILVNFCIYLYSNNTIAANKGIVLYNVRSYSV